MGRGADNFYLILGLDFLKPESDQKVILKRLNEKQKFWDKNREHREKGPKYRQYSQWVPIIASTMAKESSRNAEANDARAYVQQRLSENKRHLGGKQKIDSSTAEAMMELCGLSVELKDLFEKLANVQISDENEEIKKEDPNPKPTGFARFSKLKGSEKYLSVLRKTDLYHFLADSEEQADQIGIRNLSGKDLLEKHLAPIKKAFEHDRGNEGTAVKELASLCEDIFDPAHPERKEEYDLYLIWKQKDEIITKMVAFSGKNRKLEQGQQEPFVDALTQILKDRESAVKVFQQICIFKDISFSSVQENKNRVACGHCFAMVDISHGERKCSVCGSDLYIKCPNPDCKKEVLASSRACGYCGTDMNLAQKAEQLCNMAKAAIASMDIAKARGALARAEQLLKGYAKTVKLSAELEKLERSFSKELENLDALIAKKEFYHANDVLKTILQKAPTAQIAQAVLVENAVKEAENLYQSALTKKTEGELIQICSQIVNLCVDYPGVEALILKFPPKPVSNIKILADTATCVNTLTWDKSPSEGEICYKIIRKENTAAASVGDKSAEEIGEAGIPRVVDEHVRAGVDYYYSIYTIRAGAASEPAFAHAVNLAEANLIRTEEGDGYVRAEWKPLGGHAAAEVWRIEGETPPCRGEGERITSGSNYFMDDAVENDRAYSYLITVKYQTGGKSVFTNGVSITLFPSSVPEPVEDLTVSNVEDDIFEAVFSYEGEEKVSLYCAEQRTSFQYGDIVGMDKVTAALKPLEILSSSKNSVRFRLKDNKKYVIVPVSIKHNTAVIGECAAVAKMEKIQIKGMEWVNSTLHIRMEWPKEAVLAIALYGTDSYAKNLEDRAGKTSRSVSKKQFEADGALLLKNIEKKDYFITLFSACRVNGELVYSDGARLTFTNKEKTDIHYTIRRKGFLNKQVEIEFKSTVKTFALPEIDLISKQHAVPVYANSGNLARHIAAQEVCGSHIELFEAKSFPKDSYIKAFFTDEDINDKLSLRPAYGTDFKVN